MDNICLTQASEPRPLDTPQGSPSVHSEVYRLPQIAHESPHHHHTQVIYHCGEAHSQVVSYRGDYFEVTRSKIPSEFVLYSPSAASH